MAPTTTAPELSPTRICTSRPWLWRSSHDHSAHFHSHLGTQFRLLPSLRSSFVDCGDFRCPSAGSPPTPSLPSSGILARSVPIRVFSRSAPRGGTCYSALNIVGRRHRPTISTSCCSSTCVRGASATAPPAAAAGAAGFGFFPATMALRANMAGAVLVDEYTAKTTTARSPSPRAWRVVAALVRPGAAQPRAAPAPLWGAVLHPSREESSISGWAASR
jgi:hypothetical protein